jgi:hypothetical protein
VAEAIYLLENNCTYLNEKSLLPNVDFCTEAFNHLQLSEAISHVNFTGDTGPISFFPASLIRKTAVYNVFQFNTTGGQVIVGTSRTESGELEVNYPAIAFLDGNVPISGKGGGTER